MKVLLIDNYDSFTYNLYQYVGEAMAESDPGQYQPQVDVIRNNQSSVSEIVKAGYDRIIISPGPGSPDDPAYFGVCGAVITEIGKQTPVLGVCLGMQGMAYHFGGSVIRSKLPMHGKASTIAHDGNGVFTDLPQELAVMRYHSLIADPHTLPAELVITARVITDDDSGEIMGLRHTQHPIEGIQFHPESFATDAGRRIIANFLFQNNAEQ